ncbi:MAG: phage minor head protein [Sulfuricurvum sp.]|uniref:phage head morphogenesis protein n=1 Tax=Sulfuricurvum sp. TaxID=2025608 RepID=UPI0035627A89
MEDDLLYHSFSLPPKRAIDYLSQKGYALSFNYDELMHEAHHKAFTVAKVTKLDLLSDIHQSLIDALQKGTPFKEWKKNIAPTLVKHGWYGETTVTDPRSGESKNIYVGSRRLKTIFDTNMQVSYSAGRFSEMMELEDAIYWRYVTRDDGKVRHSHALLHGMVRHRDDPIWKVIYAPNGWHCRCKIRAYTLEDVLSRGWKITDQNTPIPDGFKVDPDWAYDIGAMHRYGAEHSYWQKISAITCKDPNAKIRTVLCPFEETVKSGYKDDMMQLLPDTDSWTVFVDRALDTSIKRHEEMRLGYLSFIVPLAPFLVEHKPLSDLILADTGSIRNLKAKGDESVSKLKKPTDAVKNTLSTEDIKTLLSIVSTPSEGYYDGKLILVYELSDSAKLVIGIDVGDKKRIYNTIYSGQLYDTEEGLRNSLEGKERIF